MQTVQMTLDENLVAEVDAAVAKRGTARSAFTREALRLALTKLAMDRFRAAKGRTPALRRLDYLPRWLAVAVGLVLGVGSGFALASHATLPAIVAFLGLLGVAGLLAWSGEPIAVTEAVAEPPEEKPPPEQPEKEEVAGEPMPPDPDLAAARNWVTIPAGTFVMGSPDDEEGRWEHEGPTHQVRVSRFACMRYPVTRGHYADLMGKDPGWPEGEVDDRPVNNVSWHDAVEFCNRLSERQGLTPCYRKEGDDTVWVASADGYRLPTEAEWEYACRAGTQSRWSFGDDEEQLGEHAWFAVNSGGQPHPVGCKRPNSWGLYDMHGNILEWCWDAWSDYSAEPQDPAGPSDDSDAKLLRVGSRSSAMVRGGSYGNSPCILRSACRSGGHPMFRNDDLGFRCVRGPCRRA